MVTYREFPYWIEEWEDYLIPKYPAPWIRRTLQKKTPACDDLSIYDNHEDMIKYLKKKYSNPGVVSDHLITDFMKVTNASGKNDDQKLENIHNRVLKLYSKLKTVGQEEQLTKNVLVLTHVIKQLPSSSVTGSLLPGSSWMTRLWKNLAKFWTGQPSLPWPSQMRCGQPSGPSLSQSWTSFRLTGATILTTSWSLRNLVTLKGVVVVNKMVLVELLPSKSSLLLSPPTKRSRMLR